MESSIRSPVMVLVALVFLSVGTWGAGNDVVAGCAGEDGAAPGSVPPAIVFSDLEKEPVYLDVASNRVTVYEPPFRPFDIQARDLLSPGNDFDKFLDWLEDRKDIRYAALLLRPGSAKFQRRLRDLFRRRGIGVAFEPWDEDREIDIPRRKARPEDGGEADSAAALFPVFFECRNNRLFFISLKELGELCDKKLEEIKELAQGNESEFLKQAAQTILQYNGFNLDFTYALMGRYVLSPDPDAEGYKMENYPMEDETMWFGSKLAALNPETSFICFFVRPDSFEMFRMARGIAWLKGFNVACELQDANNPIVIGPGGERVLRQ